MNTATESSRSMTSYKLQFLFIMFLFGIMGPMVRAIGLPSSVIACCRAWISGTALIAYIKFSRREFDRADIKSVTVPMLICGVCMAGDWIGLFEAYNYTTIATATVCYYLTPGIVFVLSPLVLGERFRLKHVICAVTSLIGMFFVSGIVENGLPKLSEIKGVLWALFGAVSYSAIILINKKYPRGDPVVRTAMQLATAAVLTTPYVFLRNSMSSLHFTPKGILLLLLLGIGFTAITYIRYFNIIVRIPARTVAIFSYADPVVAVLVSVFVMGEPITVYGIIGSVLIIGSAIVSELNG